MAEPYLAAFGRTWFFRQDGRRRHRHHALKRRPKVDLPERNGTVRDVRGDKLTETRKLFCKKPSWRPRYPEPFEFGVDLGDLVATQGIAAVDLVIDDVAALDEIDEAPKFVPGLESGLPTS